MICTQAAYESKADAHDARRLIKRSHGIHTMVRYCERCDQYHIEAELGRLKMVKRAMEVLRLKGQGFTRREIGRIVGASEAAMRNYDRILFKVFDANSAPHLIAIAIAVGVISPNEFVPEVTERNHDAGETGIPWGVGRVVAARRRRGDGADSRRTGKPGVQPGTY